MYVDGSVLVTHGGVEMGQGLHTKISQVAARALEVDIAKVHVEETATDKVGALDHTLTTWKWKYSRTS